MSKGESLVCQSGSQNQLSIFLRIEYWAFCKISPSWEIVLKKKPLPVFTISGILTFLSLFLYVPLHMSHFPSYNANIQWVPQITTRQTHQPLSEITLHNRNENESGMFFSPHKVIGRSPPSACQRGQSGALRQISISLSHSYTASWLLAVWEAHRTLPWAPSSQICHPNWILNLKSSAVFPYPLFSTYINLVPAEIAEPEVCKLNLCKVPQTAKTTCLKSDTGTFISINTGEQFCTDCVKDKRASLYVEVSELEVWQWYSTARMLIVNCWMWK